MRSRFQPFVISLVLLGLTLGGVFYLAQRPTLVVTETRLEYLPMQIGALKGTDLFFEESVYKILNADMNIFRDYVSPTGQTINLYVGYYGTAKGGRASHLPQYCYTGQGWAIETWNQATLNTSSSKVSINRMIVKKGNYRQLVYFWFQAEETIMTTGWEQNVYKFQHKLLYNRNDGAFVRVSTLLPAGQEAQAEEAVRQFSHTIMTLLTQFWPVEEASVRL